MIKEDSNKDFNSFIDYFNRRKKLYTSEKLYSLHYVTYYFLSLFHNSELSSYSLLAKRDLISGLDSLSRGNFIASRRDYRSFIESCLRLLASSYKKYIVLKRQSNHNFESSCQLRDLQSLIDTHKIGRFTNGVSKKLDGSIIHDDVKIILEIYSKLSNFVHTNEINKSHIASDLTELTTHNKDEEIAINNEIYELISYSSLIIYSSICLIDYDDKISRQTFYYYTNLLKDVISEEHVINVSQKLDTFTVEY